MPTTFKVRNVSPMLQTVNLSGVDEKGRPKSINLAPGEVSRDLSEDELRSAEIQKLCKMRVLVDVTGFADRQRLAKEAQGRA